MFDAQVLAASYLQVHAGYASRRDSEALPVEDLIILRGFK
jgi:hypothetical protein